MYRQCVLQLWGPGGEGPITPSDKVCTRDLQEGLVRGSKGALGLMEGQHVRDVGRGQAMQGFKGDK